MAGVIFRSPWTRQPRGPVVIERGNPAARHLIAAYVPSIGLQDVVSGGYLLAPTTSAYSRVPTPEGLAQPNVTGGSGYGSSAFGNSGPAPRSLLWVGYTGTPQFPGGGKLCHAGFVTSNTASMALIATYDNFLRFQIKLDTLALVATADAGSFPSTPRLTVLSGLAASGAITMFQDGSAIAVDTTTFSGIANTSSDFFGLGWEDNGTPYSGGQALLFAVFGGGLTAADHIALHRNPWQLFAPQRQIWLSDPNAPIQGGLAWITA